MRSLWILPLTLLTAAFLHAQVKVKDRPDITIVADKSKPIRKGLEAWYSQNMAAFEKKDVKAIMALRTEDFHTVTPDGLTNDRKSMEERTKGFVARIVSWKYQRNEIGTIEVEGDLARANVKQDTERMQRSDDGSIHKVRAKATQRETFRRTPAGWRLYRVDEIKDHQTWVDGVLVPK